MNPQVRRMAFVGLLAASLPVLAGCTSRAASRSNFSTKLGNCEVRATLDGGGSITTDGKAAVISFAAGKLTVEKGSLQLDGNELTKLPEDSKKIEIDCTDGLLTVKADGDSVFSTELRK